MSNDKEKKNITKIPSPETFASEIRPRTGSGNKTKKKKKKEGE